jgi:transglutaminase-like putative cysteine protease
MGGAGWSRSVSQAPEATLDVLRAATTDNPTTMFLQLPVDITGVVSDLATEVTAGAAADYDRMLAPQDWFQTFKYSTEAQAGHSNNSIENFLQIRSGSSDQFAATFAVIARTLEDPSRLAVGFTPGLLDADGSSSVFGKHSHVWPEVWFNGIGSVHLDRRRAIPGGEDRNRRRSGPATAPVAPHKLACRRLTPTNF